MAVMSGRDDEFRDSFYYRAIRTRIGAALKAQFDLSQPMPERITALLTLLGKDNAPAEPADAERGTGGEPAGDARR
jgi:hypothetical protein